MILSGAMKSYVLAPFNVIAPEARRVRSDVFPCVLQVVKAVKRKNASRDRYQMLKRNYQRKMAEGDKVMLSTEQSILREIAIMKACRHAHIVRLLAVVDDPKRNCIYMSTCDLSYLLAPLLMWPVQPWNILKEAEWCGRTKTSGRYSLSAKPGEYFGTW
jgi:serine/threonine protein kinase